MVELVAILVVTLVAVVAVRRSGQTVPQPQGALVLPAIEAPRPPARLARGSVEQPVTPMPEDLPRRRRPLRPTHARR